MRNRAVTLVEVLVVTAIVSVLISIVYAIGGAVKRKVDVSTCIGHLRLLHNSLQLYRVEWGNAQSNVGDMARLGLPPGLIAQGVDARPLVGEKEWMLCPAPKAFPMKYIPHYETFFWPNRILGVEVKPRYSDVTAVYKERTPELYDLNHNAHSEEVLNLPRARKFIIFVDLGGRLTTKQVTGRLKSMGDVGFFELN